MTSHIQDLNKGSPYPFEIDSKERNSVSFATIIHPKRDGYCQLKKYEKDGRERRTPKAVELLSGICLGCQERIFCSFASTTWTQRSARLTSQQN
jgi:hypothetical protein